MGNERYVFLKANELPNWAIYILFFYFSASSFRSFFSAVRISLPFNVYFLEYNLLIQVYNRSGTIHRFVAVVLPPSVFLLEMSHILFRSLRSTNDWNNNSCFNITPYCATNITPYCDVTLYITLHYIRGL